MLPPTAVADFMIDLAWSAGARAAHEGRSAFSAPGGGTRVGERLTERPFSLFSDPTAAGLESAPFVVAASSGDEVSVFDNGAPIGRFDVLKRRRHRRTCCTPADRPPSSARPFTPTADNLILTGGDPGRGIDDLVAGVRRGLLVTSQWYLREVDPMTLLLTGLTRDGVFLIENGEIAGAVNNFRFNMSPLDVLRQAIRRRRRRCRRCPGSGATGSPARRCRRWWSRASTCRRCRRRSDASSGGSLVCAFAPCDAAAVGDRSASVSG